MQKLSVASSTVQGGGKRRGVWVRPSIAPACPALGPAVAVRVSNGGPTRVTVLPKRYPAKFWGSAQSNKQLKFKNKTPDPSLGVRLLIEQAETQGEPPGDPLLLFSALYGFWYANF